ncbi:ACP S-malonyltransferase [Kitasatospora sp. NBC_01250]|uniref:ACP S-malonyltransferase n=1 Tax=Kitasatospora sp. NBC_01250 TaxID=2903571 RepID=UPI002E31AC23|nr:ACP S-malonyltransferase [Kitasatospora sp. NBC_01250]
MTKRTAMVFPGMGPAAFNDVGRFMVANRFARELVAVADEVLGYSLVDAFREAEGDYSEAAQVAFLVNCLASADWAQDALGVEAEAVLGPSFGEKAAVAFAQALPLPEAVRMTAELARCMEEYFSQEHTDVVVLSFVRTPAEKLGEILAELDEQGEWHDISCYIDEGFHMLSLRESRVEWMQQRLRAVGGMPLYTMRPPLHSGAFAGLRDKAEREVLSTLHFTDPKLPVVADQDGALLTTAEQVRTMLLDSIVRPLRWPDAVAGLKRFGIERVCVAGPDSLFGRVPCTTANFEVLPANPRLAMTPRRRSVVA